jgi:hypothetical protein
MHYAQQSDAKRRTVADLDHFASSPNDLPDITDIRRDNRTITRERFEDNRGASFAPRTEYKEICRRNQRHHVVGFAQYPDAREPPDGTRHSLVSGSDGLSSHQEHEQRWHLLKRCPNGF